MVLGNFLLHLGGTVRIRVRGTAVERFLNICSRHDITLRDIDRIDMGELDATLTLRDFRRLRTVMGRTGCRVHLLRRSGAPFTAHRFRHRYALFGGGIALCALIWVLLNFIWVIHLSIPEGMNGAQVQEDLQAVGVYAGMWAHSFDASKVQQEMLTRMPELAFIALNRKGNRLEIELHLRAPKPEMLDETAPTDVRATKAGVLTRVDARDGYALKKIGETVEAGEIVISALVPPTAEAGKARLTHAMGVVEARTWYEQSSRRATMVQKKLYQGKSKTRYALVFGKNRVNLYFSSSISDAGCDKIRSEMRMVIADSIEVPVYLVRETYRRYETETVTPEVETLRRELSERAESYLIDGIEGSITASSTVLRSLPGGVEMTLYAECLESIGKEAVSGETLPPESSVEGDKSP